MWLYYVTLLAALPLPAADARSPVILNWSSEAYGPDGPWHAVTFNVGSDRQPIALYPGANYASTIFADSICANTSLSDTCYAAQAGTYNASDSTTGSSSPNDSAVANATASAPWDIVYWNVQGEARQESISDEVTLGVEESETIIPNVSFTVIHDTYQTYPNGRSYPVSVGNLALESEYDCFVAVHVRPDSVVSYSMHIGSVDPPIPGSLVVGGCDRARLIGAGSAQSILNSEGILQIVLRDIGLGVAQGASPFPSFTDSYRGGLFVDGDDANGGSTSTSTGTGMVLPRTATIDPTKPYLYHPEATCNAITAFFPVSFDSGLGLYIWDTQSADYTTLTQSPGYLSFTFSKDGSTSTANSTITIRVPLQLLTLTLQEPLTEGQGQNRSYFPCFYSTDTPVLGRAFLQAAFLAVNWGEGTNNGSWVLGQAPGPGVGNASADGESIVPISVTDRSLQGVDEDLWLNSWASHWTPLNATGNATASSTHDANGLSTGAKAGIGVGAGLAGLSIIAVAIWLVGRKKQGRANSARTGTASAGVDGKDLNELAGGDKDTGRPFRPTELEGKGSLQPQEIMGADAGAGAGRARQYELE